ncbi:MAG TPA: hypothetical protein ENH41_05010 [Candidatus Omnitrophica bacterium]|nr:hypothetical protein [Candidatus Omnitrophota bacterium]
MKPTKLILTLFLTCSLVPAACSLVFAVGEDVIVAGDTQAASMSLEPVSRAATPSGSEGEIIYSNDTDDDTIFVYDGTDWVSFSANQNVATVIVAASNSLDTSRADYECNGTNDQYEINQAILDVYYNPTADPNRVGGVVYLLEGTYNISDTTFTNYTDPLGGSDISIATKGIVMRDNISLIGAGAGTVLQLVSGTSGLSVINAASVNRLLISQLTIDGQDTGSNNIGIFFNSAVTNSKIDSVWVDRMKTQGIRLYGTSPGSSTYNTISNCTISNSSSNGLGIFWADNNIIYDNIIKANNQSSGDAGIFIMTSDNNVISNNQIVDNGLFPQDAPGIWFMMGGDNNLILNNNIQGNSQQGIKITGDYNIMGGNNIESNEFSGIMSGGKANLISGNTVKSNDMHGIYLMASAADDNSISFNFIADNDVNNTLSYDGIHIDSGSNNIIISNRLMNNDRYEINISSLTATNNYLAGNYTYGADHVGEILDSGTNTKYTGKEKITLERVSDFSSSSPDASYTKLSSSGSVTVPDGKSAGDILILEGPDTGTAVPSGNIRFCGVHSNHNLGADDNLVLIWTDDAFSGTPVPSWLELSYSDN